MKARIAAMASIAVTAAMVAGCGGSSSGETRPERAPAYERKAFIEKADQLCEDSTYKTLEEREAWERKKGIPEGEITQAQQEEEIVKFLAPAVQRRVEELEALPLPEGDEDELRKFFDAFREAAERAEKNPSLQIGYPNVYTPVKEIGSAYGFIACGTG